MRDPLRGTRISKLISRGKKVISEDGIGELARKSVKIGIHRAKQAAYNIKMTRKRAAVKYDKAETQQNIGYTHSPSESFLIQSFNHVQNIRRLYNRIPLKSNQELIVCEDGSIDGSFEAWDKRLQGRNEFMIRSNDLHEIRAYTRAADYARGNLLFFFARR